MSNLAAQQIGVRSGLGEDPLGPRGKRTTMGPLVGRLYMPASFRPSYTVGYYRCRCRHNDKEVAVQYCVPCQAYCLSRLSASQDKDSQLVLS